MSRPAIAERRRASFELELQDDVLIAIGYVALRAALLDNLIDLTFQQIVERHPEAIREHLAKLSSPLRIRVIKDDLVAALPKDEPDISSFINEVFKARDERNDIMHRMWRSTDAPETKALVEVSHDKPERERRRVTASSMRKTATKLLDLALELADWKMRARGFPFAQLPRTLGRP